MFDILEAILKFMKSEGLNLKLSFLRSFKPLGLWK